ncbi:flagellar brake protein [Clostridium oryzae]|uniref:Flagellar brake protein YcgR n=1 Tax=Clostridium oryzae TaxID=1450648 RepID=A0A1V4ITA4_9CLOT|nr:flagellar brake domain-containing protein [Clostridium oryzae]OPJ63261.1 flagellar brake protein YcgR [Clostridium oryzae]
MKIELKLNARIEIQVEEEMYKSNIQNITKDKMLVSLPVKDGVYITPSRGDILEVFYYDDQYRYKFSSKVIGRVSENKIPMLSIEYPSDVERVQRREFVRINVMYDIQYTKLEARHDRPGSYVELEQIYEGTILDLSGGGFRLSSKTVLSLKDLIIAKLNFSDNQIKVMGEVVRVDHVDNKYIYGVNLINVEESTRDKIIHHIFEIMRKQKRTML